jgi:putative phosphoribosyl transferase
MFVRAYLVCGMLIFKNRSEAGERLAVRLHTDKIPNLQAVVGLARGGVEVAHAISLYLKIPMRVLVVKKISSPDDQELAIGAQAPDSVTEIDWNLATTLGVDARYIQEKIRTLKQEIKTADHLYRLPAKPVSIQGKTVVLTDDGIATGATVRVAIRWLRRKKVAQIILAVPVIPLREVPKLEKLVDAVIALGTPEEFTSVGMYYRDFAQVETSEVLQLLRTGTV